MTKIHWAEPLSRSYQAGVSKGVYFNTDNEGFAWNGLVSVVEDETGNEDSPIYIDGYKIINRKRFGDFIASVDAITAPGDDVLLLRDVFSFSYRVEYNTHYEIHLVYNARAVLSGRGYRSITDSTNLSMLSMTVSTLPLLVDENRRTSHLIINSAKASVNSLRIIESILYGDDHNDSRLPSPSEVLSIFEANVILLVTYLGDHLYEISGPDDVVVDNGDGTWTIDWPSVVLLYESVYEISSL